MNTSAWADQEPAAAAQSVVTGFTDVTQVGLPDTTGFANPSIAEASMPDSLADAQAAAAVGSTCTRVARDDRTTLDPPANASEMQLIYFVPNDVLVHDWDRASVCSDRTSSESAIGWSFHNLRKWMGTRGAVQGTRMNGKSFHTLVRTDLCGTGSCNSYRVMFVRGSQNQAYYSADYFTRIRNEIAPRFAGTNVKYMIYADVESTDTSAGKGEYNGRYAIAVHRYVDRGAHYAARWGCGDEGDTVVGHEVLHTMGTVSPSAAEHDAAHTYHTTQTSDLMYFQDNTSYSGRNQHGVAIPVTTWDAGLDSYTTRVLAFPAYLGGTPGTAIHGCPNV